MVDRVVYMPLSDTVPATTLRLFTLSTKLVLSYSALIASTLIMAVSCVAFFFRFFPGFDVLSFSSVWAGVGVGDGVGRPYEAKVLRSAVNST